MEQMLFEQKQNILVSMHAIKQRIKSVLQQDNNKKKKKINGHLQMISPSMIDANLEFVLLLDSLVRSEHNTKSSTS